MKIAIIGSGISGLVSAHHLFPDHDITVFESNDYVGGHSNTQAITVDGSCYSVDTGFIVFNDWTYPNFIQLLDELKVDSQPTEMSFSIQDQRSGLEYNGHSLNTLFAQRRNIFRPSFYRMIRDIIRFNRQAKDPVQVDCMAGGTDTMTVGEFLQRGNYCEQFRNHYLLPMGAAIWSCPPGVFAEFPIGFIAEFYKNHGLLNIGNRPTWRVVKGGSQTYVQALIQDFKHNIRLNAPVTQVRRTDSHALVSTDDSTEQFDHVIFACHSDQALKILGSDATKTEHDILSEFPYSRNVAVLHTDETLLPSRRRAWASWNYLVTEDRDSPANVTYNMNLLQNIDSPHTFCVTLNGESEIAPEKVLKRFVYHHPVFTLNRAAAQERHPELLGPNRTSFCGAYWGNGFHEDGVRSALAVVASLAKTIPAASQRNACGVQPSEESARTTS